MNSFKLVFKGEITEGKDPHKLGQALAKFLKFPEEKAHVLFSGNPICIKKALSESEANALKAKLSAVGIITYIKPVATAAPLATPVAPQQVAKPSIEAKPATATKPTVKSYDDLSKGWQKVFAEFDLRQADKLGYFASAKSPAHTSRPKMEQIKGQNVVNMNALAFVFGSAYYIAKGMWKKGIYLFLMLMLLNLAIMTIVSFITDKDLSKLPLIISSVVFGLTANYDYYRYYKLDETTWPWMPKWTAGWFGITISAIIVLILAIGTLFLVETSSDINRVKNSPLPYFNEYKMGEALDSYSACDNIRWEELDNDRGLKFVQYTCNIYRPSAESNYVAEVKMLNDFYANELKQPNALESTAVKSFIEERRKSELSLWTAHIMKPKQYNVVAQFSVINGETKVLYTGAELIYPNEKSNINETYQEQWFFQSIRNNRSVAQPESDIKKPAFNVEYFRGEIETVRRNKANTW